MLRVWKRNIMFQMQKSLRGTTLRASWMILPRTSTSPILSKRSRQRVNRSGSLLLARSPASLNFSFYVRYSTPLLLPPIIFHCVGGCWDRTQDCCDFGNCQPDALTTRLDLIHSEQWWCGRSGPAHNPTSLRRTRADYSGSGSVFSVGSNLWFHGSSILLRSPVK
jgi:hypothetical protein